MDASPETMDRDATETVTAVVSTDVDPVNVSIDSAKTKRIPKPVVPFDPSPSTSTMVSGKRSGGQQDTGTPKRPRKTAKENPTPPATTKANKNKESTSMAVQTDKRGKTKASIDKMVENIQAAVMKDVFTKLQNEILIELKTSIVADVLEQVNDTFGARLDALQESIPKPMTIEDYLEEEDEGETENIDKGKALATTPATSTWCPKLGTVLPEYAANPSED
ncbi:hypothetical protein HDU96_001795 [Phlyctochytrium bullatum]|nr:hypothetical protein HDU96_001795 [Phlyctochytrium bullatum]